MGDAYLYGKNQTLPRQFEYLIMARDIDPKIASTWSHMGDAQSAKRQSGDAMTSYEVTVQKDAKQSRSIYGDGPYLGKCRTIG